MSKKVGQATQKTKTKPNKQKKKTQTSFDAALTWKPSQHGLCQIKFLCYLISNPVDEGANVSSETTYLIGRE